MAGHHDTNDTIGNTIVLRAGGNKATSLLVQELGWVTGTSVSDGAREDELGSMRFGRDLPIAAATGSGALSRSGF